HRALRTVPTPQRGLGKGVDARGNRVPEAARLGVLIAAAMPHLAGPHEDVGGTTPSHLARRSPRRMNQAARSADICPVLNTATASTSFEACCFRLSAAA